jgi:asparagine N-glycosylation enzyme membrane subunit Stt3
MAQNCELLKTVFEQHWEHARHAENERLAFTSIFGAIAAGVLSIDKTKFGDAALPWAFFFLFVFALFGFFFCIKARSIYNAHTKIANERLKLSESQFDFLGPVDVAIKNPKISSSRIYSWFFALCSASFFSVFIYSFPDRAASICFVIIVLALFYYESNATKTQKKALDEVLSKLRKEEKHIGKSTTQ